MANKNPEVDWYFSKDTKWQNEYNLLRNIVIEAGLDEYLKWGCPCYTFQDKNIVLIHGFKNYCALLFMKGSLLKDPLNILVQQTENVQAARQIRFSTENEILALKTNLLEYIKNAVQIEKEGQKVALKNTVQFHIPAEFEIILNEMTEVKTAFYNLTPGRQRAYLLHFSAAKQSQTREARIQKYITKIVEGKGLDD